MDQKELDLKISYDPKGDVLYCSFGDPREALSVEMQDGVIVRLDPDTDAVIGITVVDFCKRSVEHPGEMLTFPLQTNLTFRLAEK